MISISVVGTYMGAEGWTFDPGPGVIPDPIQHARRLYEVYLAADPRYSGRATVPVLWDKQQGTIVSNESKEIIRMFNGAFDEVGATGPDYYPETLRGEIDELNEYIYTNVNNGVYRAGFATTPEAHGAASLDGAKQHGGRLALLHDARPLRPRVLRALQMQQAAHRRLSEPLRIRPRLVSAAGHRFRRSPRSRAPRLIPPCSRSRGLL